MFPKYDFQYLIGIDPEAAIVAISREPLTELLLYWKRIGKPKNLEPIFQLGIEGAIANDRYSLSSLDPIKCFPEFYPAVQTGLIRLWYKLPFSLGSDRLYIGCCGNNINIDDKFSILQMLLLNNRVTLSIGGQLYEFDVCISKKAQSILTGYRSFAS